MRDMSKTPLSKEEIEFVRQEIRWIEADESVFVFNDEDHIDKSTCYNFVNDRIYVTRNIFPDTNYGSTHPRDLMSVRAVLAHEYYGHRSFRQEYLADYYRGDSTYTTSLWQDECRASITAARITPNLTDQDRCKLVMDAVYRAEEANHQIKMDAFMKEVLYGYSDDEKGITTTFTGITYVSCESQERDKTHGQHNGNMSEMRNKTYNYRDEER